MNFLKRKYIIGLIGLISLCFGGLVFFNKEKFRFDTASFREVKDNYVIQIDYPIFRGHKKINKEIKNNIYNKKKEFMKLVQKEEFDNSEFNVSYSYTIKNNIYSFHIRMYFIVGDECYYKNDLIYYFDKLENINLDIEDLVYDTEIYNIFDNKIEEYMNNNNNNNLNSRDIKDKLIVFNSEYVQIILKMKKFDNEIIVNVSYDDINGYLNKNYFDKEDTEVSTLVKNEVPQIRNKSLFVNKKLVAITFDDGPSYEKTQRLIDELDKRNARVSFFMLGENAIKQPDLVKEIYLRGHTIGSHTYDHKQLTKLNEEELMYEVEHTNDIIKNIIGVRPNYLRPPYGSYDDKILKMIDMSFILWSVDVEDWKLKDVNKISQYIIDNVSDGDIVLVHDIHNETIDGVLKAIDELTKEGFAFVSLDELINYKNIKIENHTVYRFFKEKKEIS